MRKLIFVIYVILLTSLFCNDASAFWIWTSKTKKFVNPKYAVKDTPEEQFKWGMKFYEEKEYIFAAEAFTSLVEHYKDSVLAPEAQYYAGRSYQDAGKLFIAFENYQKAIDVYPFTEKIDEIIEREYNLGMTMYESHRAKLMGKEIMTDLDRAVEIFRKVNENAPFGEYSDKSQFMVAQCYKKSEQYKEAKDEFQAFIQKYSSSTLRDKAAYEVAQCTYLASFKPDYDQELTDEAIEEFRRIAEGKGGLIVSDEARDAVFLLEDRKAESLFNTAKFYERQKKYESAALYYEDILTKYPRSTFSEQAVEKLKSIYEFLKKG
ncbi:MAG: outer membrane protein assembly factor BamD [Candidatus Omnitrophota bacterium]